MRVSCPLMITIFSANLTMPVIRVSVVMAWCGRGVSYRTVKGVNKPGGQEGPI